MRFSSRRQFDATAHAATAGHAFSAEGITAEATTHDTQRRRRSRGSRCRRGSWPVAGYGNFADKLQLIGSILPRIGSDAMTPFRFFIIYFASGDITDLRFLTRHLCRYYRTMRAAILMPAFTPLSFLRLRPLSHSCQRE